MPRIGETKRFKTYKDYSLTPLTLRRAIDFCKDTHRKHPNLHGGMWAVGLLEGEELVGIAIVGRPVARLLQVGTERLEVTRVAVKEGVRNGCSKLYGACAKAARTMGATDMLTYTHADESGISLIAAGWVREEKDGVPLLFGGGDWTRKSRPRNAEATGPKHRWWTPWSKRLED